MTDIDFLIESTGELNYTEKPSTVNSNLETPSTAQKPLQSTTGLNSSTVKPNLEIRYADKITVQSRLQTFQHWPVGIKQKPAELADAGFFYTGQGDETICFYCGEGLKNWEENDDPWEQHAFWFSKCGYVNLKKGEEFIDKVKRQQPISPVILSEKCKNTSTKEEEETTERTICKICYFNEISAVFLPCGHLTACVDCALALKTCAVCRKPIEHIVRIFIP